MPPLWQCLKRPHPWLAAFLVAAILPFLDSYRDPKAQFASQVYVALVHGYQRWGRPLLAAHIKCRYHPTCSEYSIGAVQRNGIGAGLVLTWRRVRSCTTRVRAGTLDPIP